MKKPETVEQYKKWMSEHSVAVLDSRIEQHYQSVVNGIHPEISESEFWKELGESLSLYDQEYTLKTKYPLMLRTARPPLLKKPYSSFLDKTFRKNVVQNRNWPKPPRGGWLVPEKWFGRVGDIVRTTLVVKYLDGVDYLIEQLVELAEKHGLEHRTYYESRDEGYYAAHFYVNYPLTMPSLKWESTKTEISLEIQITTQLQEVTRKLLHSFYEERRSEKPHKNKRQWQWDYRSEEFGANYFTLRLLIF